MKTYKIYVQLETHDEETDEYEKEDLEEYEFESEEDARAFAEDLKIA